jgi:uncharacterized membrane protein
VPRSPVDTTGLVRFTPIAAAWTRLEIAFTYRPARTDLNDAVHSLLGPRPGRRLRTDLEHARVYIESLPTADVVQQDSTERLATSYDGFAPPAP